METKCRNCGAGFGLHRADMDQCPLNGVEAPLGKPQEWSDTTWWSQTLDLEAIRAATLKEAADRAVTAWLKAAIESEITTGHDYAVLVIADKLRAAIMEEPK